MSWEEWKTIANKMNALMDKPMFPREDRDKVIEWFNCFKDLPFDAVKTAVETWFKKSKFRPSVSDIRSLAEGAQFSQTIDWNAIQEHRRVQDFKRRAGDGT